MDQTPAPSGVPSRGDNAQHTITVIAVWLTITVAACLRLFRLDYAEYRGDDDDMVNAAVNALHQGWLQSHGLISSIPIDNGPVAMWLLMVPLATTNSLLAAGVFVALLNVATVIGLYIAVRRLWGTPLALLATILFAVNPWAVTYARRLWITAFDAPLALLALWALLAFLQSMQPAATGADSPPPPMSPGILRFPVIRGQRDRGRWRPFAFAVLSGLALSAFFQAHVVPMGEIVAVVLSLLLFWRLLRMWPTLLALAVLAVTMAPYVFTTVIPALSKTLAGQQARQPVVDTLSWLFYGHLVTGLGYQSIQPEGSRILDATAGLFTAIDWLAVVLLVAGFAAALVTSVRAVRGGHRFEGASYALLLLWCAIPPLGLMVHLVDVHPYYFVVTMPWTFVIEAIGARTVGHGIAQLVHRLRHRDALVPVGAGRWRPAALSLVAVVSAAQLALAVPFFAVLGEVWTGADYGLPLSYTQQIVQRAQAIATAGGVDRAIVVGGYDHDVHYTVYSALHRAYPQARYADDRDILLYSLDGSQPVVYVTTDDRAWLTQILLRNFASAQAYNLALPGEGVHYRIFEPDARAISTWMQTQASGATHWRFGDLAEVTATRISGAPAGENAQVTLNWQFLREPTEPLIMRMELVGADGFVWDTAGAVNYPADFWQPGDATRFGMFNQLQFALPVYVPVGSYTMRVRLLGLASGQEYGTADPLGQLSVSAPSAGSLQRPLPALPHPMNVTVTPGLHLLGWSLDSTGVQQNGVVGVVLFWQASATVVAQPTLRIVAKDGQPLAVDDTSELGVASPTFVWPTGELLADRHMLHIGGRVATEPSTIELSIAGSQPVPLGPITIEPMPRLMTLPPLPHPTSVEFNGVVRLAGYDLVPPAPSAGGSLQVVLYWFSLGEPGDDETVFVHLSDGQGKVVAQGDGPPANGSAPMTTWVEGQVVKDIHVVALPAALLAGSYRLSVGLHNAKTGTRLAITSPNPADPTEVTLTSVVVRSH